MDLSAQQLRTFLAVARRLSFSPAAEELRLASSAVRSQIRWLEQTRGMPVLEQAGGTLGLTQTGQLLVRDAERIMALQDGLEGALADADDGRQGRLTVAGRQPPRGGGRPASPAGQRDGARPDRALVMRHNRTAKRLGCVLLRSGPPPRRLSADLSGQGPPRSATSEGSKLTTQRSTGHVGARRVHVEGA